ncbi:hypothetical protein UG55_102428 [Frankia sp. EI5c]|nr:hypothetical protein UG55_102428 [Frankia sp. EI5c]
MVLPLLELNLGMHYVAFLARLMDNRSELRTAALAVDPVGPPSVGLVAENIKAVLGHVPPHLRDRRVLMALELTVHTIANRQSRTVDGEDDGLTPTMFANDLVDAVVGLLAAPHSSARRG